MEENKDIKEGIANILKQDKAYEIMKRIIESLKQNGKLLSQVLPEDDEDRTVAEGIEPYILETFIREFLQKGKLYSEEIRNRNPEMAELVIKREKEILSSKSFEEYNNELVSLEEKEAQLKDHENAKETSEEGK